MQVNVRKLSFCAIEMEYLGYILTCTGIKPQPKKVKANLAISPPKQIKDLRKFLDMVQYYRDLWARCSKMLAPLTSLVAELVISKSPKPKIQRNICGTGVRYIKKHSMM